MKYEPKYIIDQMGGKPSQSVYDIRGASPTLTQLFIPACAMLRESRDGCPSTAHRNRTDERRDAKRLV